MFQPNFDATVFFFGALPIDSWAQYGSSGAIMVSDGGLSSDINKLQNNAERDIQSVYTQYQVSAAEQKDFTLKFTTGLRYDKYSDFGSNLSPRAAFVFSFPKTNTCASNQSKHHTNVQYEWVGVDGEGVGLEKRLCASQR